MKGKKAAPKKAHLNPAEFRMSEAEFDRMMGKALGTAPPKEEQKPKRRKK